jgi:hypothetical protein
LPEVDNSPRFAGLLSDNVHSAAPRSWSVARDTFEDTQGYILVDLTLDLLQVMGRNCCRFVYCTGLSSVFEE